MSGTDRRYAAPECEELLAHAVGYALCGARPVTTAVLDRPTPCRGWDLRALLRHAVDSLAALREGVDHGRVALRPATEPRSDEDLIEAFHTRARGLLGGGPPGPEGAAESPGRGVAGSAARRDGEGAGRTPAPVTVGDWPLPASVLARTGALEIAVHGWDIARTTGLPRPIPPGLATELLRIARQLVPAPSAREPLFGPPVTVPARADPSDRLVAFLGRDPGRW